MPAYVIAESPYQDDDEIRRYRAASAAAIAAHGGRYLARGQTPVAVEGQWPDDHRIVIIEFPSLADARAWYDSPDYRAALAARSEPPIRRILFIDGGLAHPVD
ncbi:DUF1330 domain-containing protein [Actinokineospora enzanensis]|uniref:DUF1330 domain-containing protein n=1 Tax=Actinokineospora enzanensis TaxID=155975 RepID=UPI0004759CC2|nr:DUF1330 domain-containing protein [Actinokineospora enzanensis]